MPVPRLGVQQHRRARRRAGDDGGLSRRLRQVAVGITSHPHVDSYAGFIFGSVDPKAPSLTDYLGDTTFYLDLIAKKTAGGLEVIGHRIDG